jgi:membrane-bound ClpP family serine protease
MNIFVVAIIFILILLFSIDMAIAFLLYNIVGILFSIVNNKKIYLTIISCIAFIILLIISIVFLHDAAMLPVNYFLKKDYTLTLRIILPILLFPNLLSFLIAFIVNSIYNRRNEETPQDDEIE